MIQMARIGKMVEEGVTTKFPICAICVICGPPNGGIRGSGSVKAHSTVPTPIYRIHPGVFTGTLHR